MGPTLENVFEALADLLDAHAEAAPEDLGPGERNFRCQDCEGCYDCRFCVGCRACEHCTYCEGCESCKGCTQCRDSYDLQDCSHSEHSRACARCSYVALCFACTDCVQCFACVGLEGEEFCVLNEKKTRKDYFELVGKLRAELDKRAAAGFLPAFEDDPEAWFQVFDQESGEDPSASPSPPRPAAAPRGDGPSVTRGHKPRRPDRDGPPSARPAGRSPLRAGQRPSRP